MKKVLIVDDNPVARSYIGYCLKQFALEIIYAEDGLDALAKLRREIPDLIFLDINMSQMNGFVLCRKLKNEEKTKNIPIVFVTVRNTDWDRKWGIKAGANGYITKPFGYEEINEAVRTFLPPEEEDNQ
ncbi:MAG TPA: two-component system response regulator [Elusimicrobia bacterium]|jgi:CheY-like chemotaxis protein|nr:two-component system response regulator [Elusimicrobiota bacterium]